MSFDVELFSLDVASMSAAYMSAVNAPHLVLWLDMRGDHMVVMGYNALGTWFVRSFFLLEDGTLDLRAVLRLTSSVCCSFIFIYCWSSSRLAFPTQLRLDRSCG
jgi:hypothetical protein